ncbi:M23 family metallopeptidase [Georgenia thermotolerans]|uniref:Peptidoglycan DD-metalloendopeptidase family protein n=1 Tax=Georgenia thermotolerans TaxID=527326 RepID=A0A7J5UQC8_9MICO|nr:M23 family metallopeptidase [Georgenia thermotolerans]KAE8764559.1 peptidoglycan DD-metalloendopeptidase family protein [Georgenia thermotolerans]
MSPRSRSWPYLAAALLAPALALAGPAATGATPRAGSLSGPLDRDGYALTSHYGPRCIPTVLASTFHKGVDLGASEGSPIVSVAPGTVVRTRPDAVAGQWILIEHTIDGRRVYSSYSHVRDADAFVREGWHVNAGQKIAEVSSTGVSTAPHLHLEIWLDTPDGRNTVEPVGWFRGRGIDLAAAATRAMPWAPPASCTYYAVGSTPIRSAPSASSPVVATVGNHTPMSSTPGAKTGDFIAVSAAGVSGWAPAGNVSPERLGVPEGTVTRTTTLRGGPGAGTRALATLAPGTALDRVVSFQDDWYQVHTSGRAGWVHGRDFRMEEGVSQGVESGFFVANSFRSTATRIFDFGEYYDRFLAGDWDGDGTDTFAVRRGNAFHIRNSLTTGGADRLVQYGNPGDELYVGDWDGDGIDTFAVRRGNQFHIKNSVTSGYADRVITYGDPGDDILVGDWDGDGTDTFAVRRGNRFHVKNTLTSGYADLAFSYGNPGDEVLVGDWDGNGTDTLGVQRSIWFHLRNSLTSGVADVAFGYGNPGDETFVGDWDGDGTDTFTLYRM